MSVQTRAQAIEHCKAIIAPYEVQGVSGAFAFSQSEAHNTHLRSRVQAADLLLTVLSDTAKIVDRIHCLTRTAVHLSDLPSNVEPDLHNAYALAFSHLRECIYEIVPAKLHDQV